MSIWITSDSHVGHHNILRFCNRPFSNVKEMDEFLLDNWNSNVKPNDTVYHLGDVAMNYKKRKEFIPLLNGKKILIKGNHDHKVSLDEGWYEIHDHRLNVSLSGKHVVMDHYPLESWDRSFHGSIHLHGHVHAALAERDDMLRLDVGVDNNNMKLFLWDDILAKMNEKWEKIKESRQ